MTPNRHAECVRFFYHYSNSDSLGNYCLNHHEIQIGLYHPQNGNITGALFIRWQWVGSNLIPKLEIYADSWDILGHFTDVFNALREFDGHKRRGDHATPEMITKMLFDLGIHCSGHAELLPPPKPHK